MAILMEVLKSIFFFLSIAVGVFFVRGETMMGSSAYATTKILLLPGYLLFCGTTIGYLISRMWMGYNEEKLDQAEKTKIYTKSFMIGLGLGVILALLSILI